MSKKSKVKRKNKSGLDSSGQVNSISSSQASTTNKGKNIVWLCAGLIFLIGIVIRYFAFSTPIGGDEAVYSIIGRKAILGASLYDEVYEMKPPLLFYVYGISNLIFTWDSLGLRLTGLTLVIANSALLYKFARIYKDQSVSFLVAAVCFFFLNNIYAYATETAAEHFVITFVLAGFYLLSKPQLKDIRANIFLAGLLIAGGAMIKQTAALFGLSSIALLIWYSLKESSAYKKDALLRNILFLALGAFSMILLNILPIIVNGSLQGAKYWLFEVPSSYTSSVSISESMIYLKTIGGWIIKYQFTTILLCALAALSLLLNYKKKYFPLILILISTSLLTITPGFRFYGQYWIPMLTILPLCIISLGDLVKTIVRPNLASLVLPIFLLASILVDSLTHQKQYFESGYLNNAESAHPGIYPSIYFRMTEYLSEIMNPEDDFLMLGSEPFTYFMVDRFPKTNHIFPRSISRDSPENKAYQEDAIKDMRSGNYDYIMLTVTGKSWQASEKSNLTWYDDVFKMAKSSYVPLLAYNLEEGRYYDASKGQKINIYKPFQIIAFKRK